MRNGQQKYKERVPEQDKGEEKARETQKPVTVFVNTMSNIKLISHKVEQPRFQGQISYKVIRKNEDKNHNISQVMKTCQKLSESQLMISDELQDIFK